MDARHAPDSSEYNEYYEAYTSQVPPGDLFPLFEDQMERLQARLGGLSEEVARRSYEPGKWTVQELVGHLLDIEWVFSYRALRIARGDSSPMPGVDQDQLVAGTDFSQRTFADMLDEYRHLRSANLHLFRGFGPEALERRGQASGFEISTRAMLHVMLGHVEHHLKVLKERYDV